VTGKEKVYTIVQFVHHYPDFRTMLQKEGPKKVLSSGGNIEQGVASYNSLSGYKELVKKFLFDIEDFKKAEISHDFNITEIKIPKNETDPAKMRENAIRQGKIIRQLLVDEKPIKKEIDFEV